MKILVSFENRVRLDSTGMYLLSAFKQLGYEVIHVLPESIMEVRPGDADLFVKCDDGQKVTRWNPELRPSHYFAIDTHIESDWRIALARDGRFDSVSVVHSEGLKLDWGRDDVYWNPVGCDLEQHYAGWKEKIYDGCFIGNFHNNLAAPRVDMLDVFFKACPGPIFFGNRTFKDMAEKYAESKLIFNRSIHGDCNMRVFEAMCSGSCLVTDRVPDLDALGFVDGVHYVGYSNGEELASVVRSLLTHSDRREKIAAAGRAEVRARHTYARRVTVLLEKACAATAAQIEGSPRELEKELVK